MFISLQVVLLWPCLDIQYTGGSVVLLSRGVFFSVHVFVVFCCLFVVVFCSSLGVCQHESQEDACRSRLSVYKCLCASMCANMNLKRMCVSLVCSVYMHACISVHLVSWSPSS